jgi:hypothetical protein
MRAAMSKFIWRGARFSCERRQLGHASSIISAGACAAYKESRKLIDEIEADLGGADRLSTGERQPVQHAAVLGAILIDYEARWIAGQPIDPAAFGSLINNQRRLFEVIGLFDPEPCCCDA